MKDKPNILWIVTTQWRAQACGYAEDVNARTPVLDRLAAESVNYTQAVTPHPLGPFARAALLTGVPSPENGVKDYHDPLPIEARTVAHEMAAAGYRTAFFGKWHLAPRDSAIPLVGEGHARTPVPRERRGGFDFWEGFEGGFQLNDPWIQGTRFSEPVQLPGYQSDVVSGLAGEWITDEGRTCEPWFAVVSLEAPHPPYAASAGGIPPADPAQLILRDNVPTGSEIEERARRELAGYYAHIEATDRAIGRLLEKVSRENTVVVFMSVHGDMHGSHGLFRKGWPHEESVRVPLLVRHPGMPCGQNVEAVSLIDLSAMARAWARGELWVPATDCAKISMPSVVRLPDQCDRVWRGVRTSRHKLIVQADGTPWMWYDLAIDPGEQTNLVGEPDSTGERERLRVMLASG